jgi:plastocyanin domain-containing protein
MSPDKVFVTISGIILIFFTYWFFFLKKREEVEASGEIDILVRGGYSPEIISVKKGKPITLNFIREDENSCLEEVVLSDFRIKKYLPLNKKVSIQITPDKTGEYSFSCGMNMFHGKLIVKN